VDSRVIRKAAGFPSSRLRPGAGFGLGCGFFLVSRFPVFLFPMPKVYNGARSGRASGGEAAAADHVISSIQAWSKIESDDLTVLICDYMGRGA
jgi:hypothetical protein